MTIHFLDSSAWIKRYFVEPGSDQTGDLFVETAQLVSSRLAVVEVVAAVVRRARHERIAEQFIADQVRNVRQDAAAMDIIELEPACMRLAEDLAARLGLRGADAVHLAAALVCRDGHPADSLLLVASDAELLAAAAAAGLATLDPAARP